MITREPPLNEVRERGLRALARELGPAGLIRFMQQYQTGSGDYTKQRKKLLAGDTMKSIAAKLRRKRKPR
ncbi:MAG TPA: hypothetical protein VGP72_12425 [Planctomycetota bacterium]|jgi:hypothetical protein